MYYSLLKARLFLRYKKRYREKSFSFYVLENMTPSIQKISDFHLTLLI